jgi:hypothetical protein
VEEKVLVADFTEELYRTNSGRWLLENPEDAGVEPRELTPKEAKEWLPRTGPANALLAQAYFQGELSQ